MKRYFVIIFALIFILTSCSNKEDYSLLKAENEELKTKINMLEEEKLLSSKDRILISGGFEAKVRHKIPDYNLDDKSPLSAVVTMFQSGPMVIYLGEDLIDDIEEGKSYFFTISEKEVWLKNFASDSERLVENLLSYGACLKIKEVKPIEGLGLEGNKIQIKIEEVRV